MRGNKREPVVVLISSAALAAATDRLPQGIVYGASSGSNPAVYC